MAGSGPRRRVHPGLLGSTAIMSADRSKEAAGRAAARLLRDGMRVGLGTGSTAHWFIVAAGEAVRSGLRIQAVATSEVSAQLAGELGIELVERAATTLRSLDGSRAVTLTRVLLSRLFPHGASPPPQQASRLTPEQRVLVETLASEPRIWTTRGMQFGNFSVMLTGHGLPGDAGSMQRYLGGEILEECLPAGMRRQRTSG